MNTISPLHQVFRDYIADVLNRLAKRTAETYKNGIGRLAEYLLDEHGLSRDAPLSSLKIEHFYQFPAWMNKREYSTSTQVTYKAAAKSFFDWLVVDGLFTPDYSEAMRLTKAFRVSTRKRSSRVPRVPTSDAVDRIRSTARDRKSKSPIKERDIALIEFLYYTGCRAAEAAKLKVKDVNLKENKVVVTGKGDKQRVVRFSEEAKAHLLNYWKVRRFREPGDPVFAGHSYGHGAGGIKKCMSTKTVWLVVTTIAEEAGIDKGSFSPHWFRHYFATKVLDETDNLALVQDMLGHATPQSTRVYAKVTDKKMKTAYDGVFEKK